MIYYGLSAMRVEHLLVGSIPPPCSKHENTYTECTHSRDASLWDAVGVMHQ